MEYRVLDILRPFRQPWSRRPNCWSILRLQLEKFNNVIRKSTSRVFEKRSIHPRIKADSDHSRTRIHVASGAEFKAERNENSIRNQIIVAVLVSQVLLAIGLTIAVVTVNSAPSSLARLRHHAGRPRRLYSGRDPDAENGTQHFNLTTAPQLTPPWQGSLRTWIRGPFTLAGAPANYGKARSTYRLSSHSFEEIPAGEG